MKYGFEAIMSNEFRTLKGECLNIVPRSPGYENVSIDNKVYATIGSVPGQSYVEGGRFLEIAYGFPWSHVWMVCPFQLYIETY